MSAWGQSWGSFWGAAWGSIVGEPTKTGGDDAPRGGRYQVKVKDKLHLFDTDYEAVEFLNSLSNKVQKIAKVQEVIKPSIKQTKILQSTVEYDQDEEDIEDILMML